MSGRKISGYWIFVIAATATGVILVYFFGASLDPSPFRRIGGVVMVGAFLVLLRAHFSAAWRFAARHAPGRKPDRYQRDPMARVGAGGQQNSALVANRLDSLRMTLQDRH
jgi:type VI secretion system protein ImpL